MTAYQEQASATTITGTIAFATFRAASEFAAFANSRKTIAHWTAKQISATVATDRPTKTLDSQVSNRQIRCTSARGRTERKAQPNT